MGNLNVPESEGAFIYFQLTRLVSELCLSFNQKDSGFSRSFFLIELDLLLKGYTLVRQTYLIFEFNKQAKKTSTNKKVFIYD